MRAIAFAAALIIVLHSVTFAQHNDGQTGYCPQTHALGTAPTGRYWLEGSIDNKRVRMYLDRGGTGVVGLFYAPAGDWTPTFLGGEWSASGIALQAETGNGAPVGHLHMRFVKGTFVGSWTPNGSGHANPVRFASVPQPSCGGGGEWKQFDDRNWPMSFSYPAEWHIRKDGSALHLICPDPQAMASNSGVTIYSGRGEPIGPSKLVHCSDGWEYGPKCGAVHGHSDLFPISLISQQEGKTILNIEREWRVYCSDGGYVGQGDGEDRVVLLDNDWIEFAGDPDIVDRMVNSVRVTPSTL
jgi:hypothetical protein